MNRVKVANLIARLQLQGYKVNSYENGWATEINGYQVFRATHIGNECYDVKMDGKIFPDV